MLDIFWFILKICWNCKSVFQHFAQIQSNPRSILFFSPFIPLVFVYLYIVVSQHLPSRLILFSRYERLTR